MKLSQLQAIRTKRGMTRRALAEQTKLPYWKLDALERGRDTHISEAEAERIASVLGRPLAHLQGTGAAPAYSGRDVPMILELHGVWRLYADGSLQPVTRASFVSYPNAPMRPATSESEG